MEVQSEEYLEQLESIKSYKLLIVDDNRINQIVTKKLLDRISVESDVVESGIKAIELVKTNHYDCVLMDLYMPEIDGYESALRIREFNETVTIVALTAASSDELEEKISNAKMDGFILKPFVLNDFVAKIVSAVKEKNQQ